MAQTEILRILILRISTSKILIGLNYKCLNFQEFW